MTTKLKGGRLEAEVDRARAEGNWKRLTDLLPSVRSKSSGIGDYHELYEGEIALETYLEQQGEVLRPSPENAASLKNAETLLLKCYQDKASKPGVLLESQLLLAKLQYVLANYDQALKYIDGSGMDSGSTPFTTLRTLRLIAEAYAIKGLSLEVLETGDKKTNAKKAMFCFEKAAELTISYVSEMEKTVSNLPAKGANPLTSSMRGSLPKQEKMGDLLECCLEKVANLGVREKNIERSTNSEGIEWYRRIITCLGDKSTGERLQQKLSRQLAELLFRAVLPDGRSSTSQALNAKSQNLNFYTGSQKAYFSPSSRTEEIILLLLISEVLSTREVVLSRSDEQASSRLLSIRNAKSVYNLLTLVLSTIRQYHILSNIFERAMKFANDDSYLWQQFGISLLCRGRWLRAARVLDQSISVDSTDSPVQHLLASQLYIQHLAQYDVAIEHANTASQLCQNAHFAYMKPRCMLLHALGHGMNAQLEASWDTRKAELLKSVNLFEKCIDADPHDYLALYYCAVYHAIVRDLDGARDRCARALELNPDQPAAIILLALLFTADGDLKGALELVTNALKDFPNNYGLLVLRMAIETKFARVDASLETCAALLEFWKKKDPAMDEDRIQATLSGIEVQTMLREGLKSATSVGDKPNHPAYSSQLSMVISNTVIGTSSSQAGIDMSACDHPQSEIGAQSSANESTGIGVANTVVWTRFRAQANMWMSLAELFIAQDRVTEVAPCVEQAVALFPQSYQAHYLKGRLFAVKADTAQDANVETRFRTEAKAALLSALALNPVHSSSLSHLALIYGKEDNHKMAEQLYKELVRVDPLNCDGWQELGCCQMRRGLTQEASKSFATAANLDRSTPLLPFNSIPLVFPSLF